MEGGGDATRGRKPWSASKVARPINSKKVASEDEGKEKTGQQTGKRTEMREGLQRGNRAMHTVQLRMQWHQECENSPMSHQVEQRKMAGCIDYMSRAPH